jgi:hypothetical protein
VNFIIGGLDLALEALQPLGDFGPGVSGGESGLEHLVALIGPVTSRGVNLERVIQIRLVLALLLVLPAQGVETAWGPLELRRLLRLMSLAHVVFQTRDRVLLAAQTLCQVGGHADALVVAQLHDPSSVPNVVLLQVDVLYPLGMAQVAELIGRRRDKPLVLWVRQDLVVVEGLQQLVQVL